MRFVRRELGVEAFGINWFELPPNAEGHEHDEAGTGQEEVNVVVPAPAGIASTASTCPSATGRSSVSTPRRRACPSPVLTA